MKVTTQVITPEWAKEPLIEIVADGGKPIYLGARKCAVIAQCAGQVAAFGNTWQPKAAKTTEGGSRAGRNVGSARITGGTLANGVAVAPIAAAAVSPDIMAQFASMQAQFNALLAAQAKSVVPVAAAPTNGKGKKGAAAVF